MAFGDDLNDDLEQWSNPDFLLFLQCLGAMFDPVYSIVMDQNTGGNWDTDPYFDGITPGWSILFSVNNCPTAFLPYLAQFVGVSLPFGVSDATARSLIQAEAGQQRGTLASITAAAQRNLVPGAFLEIYERTGPSGPNAYEMMLYALTVGLLTDSADLIAAVEAVKPAGIQITYVITAGWTWSEATGTWTTGGAGLTWAQTLTTDP
jgi:P2-related tail formation protein